MNTKALAVAAVLGMAAGGAAQAASITLDFPSGASTVSASAGKFFFTAGDFAEQTFDDTGIFDLTDIDFAINLTDNVLNDGGFVNFDVIVNGTTVGGFTISDGDGLGQFDYSFGYVDPDVLNDDYTLRFEVTNTVPSGDGSVAFNRQTSSATLTGDMSVIPLPAGFPLLLAGVGGLAVLRRRKKK